MTMINSPIELNISPDARVSSSGYTWLDDNGIILAVGTSRQVHTVEDAMENTRINDELAGEVRRPFLIDMSKVKSMSKDAREFYAGKEPQKSISAVAILTSSSVGKVVANFFLLLTPPSLPTRLFTDFNEAIEWLSRFKANQR